MTMPTNPIRLTDDGILAVMPGDSILNIAGVNSPSFTINGQGVVLADGTSSTGGQSITLQDTYNNIPMSAGEAAIVLVPGKSFAIKVPGVPAQFRIDGSTGKVTIWGDLEIKGGNTIINSIIQDSDHWLISPTSGATPALMIRPDAGVVFTEDLVRFYLSHGGQPIFRITNTGDTVLAQHLTVGGLINGVDIGALSAKVDTHIAGTAYRHQASAVDITPLLAYPMATNVQQALEALSTAPGSGTVTSVNLNSTSLIVSGGPITNAGSITVNLAPATQTSLGKADTALQPAALAAYTPTSGLGSLAFVTPTGTPNGTKFLRDDGSWQTVSGSGTVTSVGLASTTLSVAGSPITSSGSMVIELTASTLTALSKANTAVQPASLALVATTGQYNDLLGKPTIPPAQVNSDWNAASGVAQILNKPTIPPAQVNSDWNAVSGVAQILNKPTIPSGDLADVDFPPSVTGKYLRDDGTWQPVAGGGVASVVGTAEQILVDNTDPSNPVLSLDESIVDMINNILTHQFTPFGNLPVAYDVIADACYLSGHHIVVSEDGYVVTR